MVYLIETLIECSADSPIFQCDNQVFLIMIFLKRTKYVE